LASNEPFEERNDGNNRNSRHYEQRNSYRWSKPGRFSCQETHWADAVKNTGQSEGDPKYSHKNSGLTQRF